MRRIVLCLALVAAAVRPAVGQELDGGVEEGVGKGEGKGTKGEGTEGEEKEVIEIEDDDLDVGPDVDFSNEDLESSETGGGEKKTEEGAVTRLETLVMGYGRMGVDLVQDEKKVGPDGIAVDREDTFFFRFHGRAAGTGRFGRRAKVKVEGRFDAEASFDQSADFGVQRYEGNIWEAYLDLYGDRVDLRAGNQIIAWGYADLLSPNDIINPRDLRRGPVVPMDELRIPVLAAKATGYAGPLSFTGIYVPVAPADRFELLDGDYAILGPNAPTEAERRVGAILRSLAGDPVLGPSLAPIFSIDDPPENGVESGELGASAELRSQRLDLAGYFYWGHERGPRIRVAPDLSDLISGSDPAMLTPDSIGQEIADLSSMGVAAVRVDYPRRLHLGAAAETRFAGVGVSVEGAYTPEAAAVVTPSGAGPLLSQAYELPRVGGAVSVDYNRGDELTLLAEGSYTRVLDVPSDREVFGLDGAKLYVVGARVAWKPIGRLLSLRFLGFVDVTSPSYAIKPSVRLDGTDHLSVEIAVGLYGGPAGSMGGNLDRNDEVLLTVRYGL